MKSNEEIKNRKILLLQKKYRKSQPQADETAMTIYAEFSKKHPCTSCARCCTLLGPRIRKNDIAVLAKHLSLKENEFFDRYCKSDEDGDIVFKNMPCPFLGSDKLCRVYESRPKACSEYPHISAEDFFKMLPLHDKNYNCCPAVKEVVDKMSRNL